MTLIVRPCFVAMSGVGSPALNSSVSVCSSSSVQVFPTLLGSFVGSLTPKGNDLVQWRFYGDDARGFALGFPAKAIRDLNAYVTRVIYGRAETAVRQAEAIDEAFEIVDRNTKHVLEERRRSFEFLRQLSVQLSVPLLWNSFSSKDLSYKQEKEVRLMAVKRAGDRSGVFTRARRGEEVHYVKVSVPLRDRRDFSRVVIGPYAHPEAPLVIKKFLELYGIGSASLLHRSRIPYRSAEQPDPIDAAFDLSSVEPI